MHNRGTSLSDHVVLVLCSLTPMRWWKQLGDLLYRRKTQWLLGCILIICPPLLQSRCLQVFGRIPLLQLWGKLKREFLPQCPEVQLGQQWNPAGPYQWQKTRTWPLRRCFNLSRQKRTTNDLLSAYYTLRGLMPPGANTVMPNRRSLNNTSLVKHQTDTSYPSTSICKATSTTGG